MGILPVLSAAVIGGILGSLLVSWLHRRRQTDRSGALPKTDEMHVRSNEESDVAARAADALRDSERRYRMLFLANPHPMWVCDRETLAFMAVNDAAIQFYGYGLTEFMRLALVDLHRKQDADDLRRYVSERPLDPSHWCEWRHVRKGGSEVYVEMSTHGLVFDGRDALLIQAHDVTSRRQLEAQFRQAQKMEAVGRLAGGVAHDFNNLITVILGYGRLGRKRGQVSDQTIEDFEQIERAARRAATLTRQLLAFSRLQVLQPRVLDLNRTIVEMDDMLRRLCGEDIELLTAPTPHLGQVLADSGQIEQVVLNLVVNARDAMPEGGRLTIETANVRIGEARESGNSGPPPGSYVMLAISDDGMGMDLETRAKAFEPFFTTKEIGKGTGLGLSTVLGIVEQSSGFIDLRSEPGRGTTFKIYLPRVSGMTTAESARVMEEAPGGTEALLVVEDDDMLRTLMSDGLRERGYQVSSAANRDEAWRLCESGILSGSVPALAIVDVVMPGAALIPFLQRLRTILPEMRLLCISGYTDRAIRRQGSLDAEVAFLLKPFTIDTLLLRVREELDSPRSAAA